MTAPDKPPGDKPLTAKQDLFFQELGRNFNPLAAARAVGLGQAEYDQIMSDPFYAPLLRRAQEATVRRIEAERNPKGTPVGEQSPVEITRDFVNREIASLLDDLKAERISPGQATAGRGLLEALAKVNGLITTEVNVNVRKSVETMSTQELEAYLSGKLIDVTPTTAPTPQPTDGARRLTPSPQPTG